MGSALKRALRDHSIDVISATEADMLARLDPEHLDYAAREGRVLFSFNISDYCKIHAEWLSAGRNHAGLLLAVQKKYSVGEQLRRLSRLVRERSAESMRDHVEFLSDWG